MKTNRNLILITISVVIISCSGCSWKNSCQRILLYDPVWLFLDTTNTLLFEIDGLLKSRLDITNDNSNSEMKFWSILSSSNVQDDQYLLNIEFVCYRALSNGVTFDPGNLWIISDKDIIDTILIDYIDTCVDQSSIQGTLTGYMKRPVVLSLDATEDLELWFDLSKVLLVDDQSIQPELIRAVIRRQHFK